MQTFVDIFTELADEADKLDARRAAKALERNGIDSIEKLISTDDVTISEMKGIGPRSMVVIGKIKTAEKAKTEKKTSLYEKFSGKSGASQRNIRYCLQKGSGCSYLEACNIEAILRKNGCNTVNKFMKLDPETVKNWKFIGPKRLEKIIAAKNYML